MEAFTTWLMVGGGIITLFSLLACLHVFSARKENRLAGKTALIGFWISFYGVFMDHRLMGLW